MFLVFSTGTARQAAASLAAASAPTLRSRGYTCATSFASRRHIALKERDNAIASSSRLPLLLQVDPRRRPPPFSRRASTTSSTLNPGARKSKRTGSSPSTGTTPSVKANSPPSRPPPLSKVSTTAKPPTSPPASPLSSSLPSTDVTEEPLAPLPRPNIPTYRDPSRPRNPVNVFAHEWPWIRQPSQDPDYIAEQRLVFARPSLFSGSTEYFEASVAFVFGLGLASAWWLYHRTLPDYADRSREPELIREQSWEGRSGFVYYSHLFTYYGFPIGSLIALSISFDKVARNLRKVNSIVQTRTRPANSSLRPAAGADSFGGSTISTYVVVRGRQDVPAWCRDRVKAYEEIDPSQWAAYRPKRRSWTIPTQRMMLSKPRRFGFLPDRRLSVELDEPQQALLEGEAPIVLSDRRLQAVFGRIHSDKEALQKWREQQSR